MNEEHFQVVTDTVAIQPARPAFSTLCWGAIIGGTVATIGIQILLSALSVGAGLALFEPRTNAHPVTAFSEGTAAMWTMCALVALFFGSVVAGRFSQSIHGGFVHGILVWCLTLIISLCLLTTGLSMILGGALRVLGEGIGMGGKAAVYDPGGLVKEGARRGDEQIQSFIQEAVQSVPTNAAPKAATRAQREVGFAITKLFATGGDITAQTNRAALISALMDYTQMSETDATKTVNDWTISHKNLQAELEQIKATAGQEARAAADQAAHDLATAGIWSFFGLLLGLLVSAGGGVLGADQALRRIKATAITGSPTTAN